MNIASASHISASAFSQAIQRQPEARESGPERDGDTDDAKAVKPAATVNLSGQTVGGQISVSA
jgi:hypothetical protein